MMHELKDTQYKIYKPSFYKNKDKLGEYDMLIYDTFSNKYWAFEIKHTTAPYYKQHKHLKNDFIREIIDRNYGSRENAAVLYRGSSCEDSDDGSLYLNITDFMLAVEKHHDMDKAMSELAVGISRYAIEKQNRRNDEKEDLKSGESKSSASIKDRKALAIEAVKCMAHGR